MLPVWMLIAKKKKKKAENEQDSIEQFNQANTQNLLEQNNQQMSQFNTDMNKLFHS